MSRSWMWAAKRLGFTLAIGAPTNYLPLEDFRRHLDCDNVIFTTNPVEAVRDASVINTDVWLSMGQEAEGQSKEKHFYPYQVNEELLGSRGPRPFRVPLPARLPREGNHGRTCWNASPRSSSRRRKTGCMPRKPFSPRLPKPARHNLSIPPP